MKKSLLGVALTLLVLVFVFVGCASQAPEVTTNETEQASDETVANEGSDSGTAPSGEQKNYYYVGINNNHPYFYDIHQGFEFAAEQFGCKVTKLGPDGWDPAAQAQALEQAITMEPDGIVTCIYDASILPGVKKASEAGIPVVAIETTMDDADVMTYIGLNNVDSGRDTAKKLIELAGDSGKVVALGFWGTSNMDQKLAGFEEYLTANSSWEIIAKLDDKAETEAALEAAKTAFNNYGEMTAICGFDSSSGAGIGAAMDELGIEPGSVTAVVHDREVATLEYIKSGHLQCTLANKTASMPYFAVGLLEQYYKYDVMGIPVSADNVAAGVNPIPQFMYAGTVFITQDNVDGFIIENMTALDSPNYE